MKKYLFIIGIICVNHTICLSQNSKQHNDKYVIVLDIQQQLNNDDQVDSSAIELTKTVNSFINVFVPENVIYIKSTGKIYPRLSEDVTISLLILTSGLAMKMPKTAAMIIP